MGKTSSLLYRWGLLIARRRRTVLAAWVLLLILCASLYPSLRGALAGPYYGAEGAESSRVEQLIERRLFGAGGEVDTLVFYSPRHIAREPSYRRVVGAVLAVTARQRGVRSIVSPYSPNSVSQISRDGHVASAVVAIGGSTRRRFALVGALQRAAARAAGGGIRVWLTGPSPIARDLTNVETADIERAETIGVPVAFLILLLALGAVVAATIPLLLAGAGLLLTYATLVVLAKLFSFDIFLLTIVTMVGVGIGIDYALFIVSRFCEELARRERSAVDRPGDVTHAVAAALATSGRTILISGMTVAAALASLFLVDAPLFREVAGGTFAVVSCTLLAALTLLPAVLATLGRRVGAGALPRRMRPADARPASEEGQGGWARWAMTVMRHPIPIALVSAAVLIAAATPVLGLRYGISLDTSSLAGTSSGRGGQALTRAFSPGAVSPVEVALTGSDGRPFGASDVARAEALRSELEASPLVFATIGHRGGGGILLSVVLRRAIDSSAASAFVRHVRTELAPGTEADGGPSVLVGGATARLVDFTAETSAKLPLVVGVVLGLSLLMLTAAFRSILLAVKAVVMNLLATTAAIGLLVVVFQEGHGEQVLGFSSPGFIQVYLPLLVFALLFGLSMDYEVFLIGRMREVWLRTHDNRLAVASGLEHTARPISAAAAIMVAVFGSFVTANVMEVKQFGFALAAAVALDATLIRLVLVPALMRLFGSWNWWLPQLRALGSPAVRRL